ncbi:methyl-accepting chemotaxis protein [Pseudomonas inefficax]|jgi:methyl-accepting chemotaxis protein|nr:methyl-accepting chemotaxis protein [Pseudomonas inefficax]WNN39213.1 methyl-accepting chemotaxis protein [Pseudomonas inefficax]
MKVLQWGISAMERFSFSRKFQVLMLVFLIPLGYGLWALCSGYRSELSRIEAERRGVALLATLGAGQAGAASGRNLAARWRATDVAARGDGASLNDMTVWLGDQDERREQLQALLDQGALDASGRLERALASEVESLSSEHQRLERARQDPQALASWWADAHNAATRSLQATGKLIELAASDHGLRRDTWADTSELIDIITFQVPDLTRQLTAVGSTGQGVIGSGGFNLLTRSQLRDALAATQATLDTLAQSTASTAVAQEQEEDWQHATQAGLEQIASVVRKLEQDFFRRDITSLQPMAVSNQIAQALTLANSLQASTQRYLDQRLSLYQARAWQGGLLALSLFSVMTLLALYGLLCVQVSIRRTTAGITRMAHSLSEGDLRSRVSVLGRDELATIGHGLNAAQEQLQSTIHGIIQQTHGVTATVSVLDEQAGASLQAADNQRQQVALIAAAAVELASTARSVAQTCSEAVVHSAEARNLASAGQLRSLQTTQGMQQLTGRLDEAAVALEQLRERTQRIDVVVAVIRNIAEQTNLLALNASIEAARAGEHGRGFAVVADQVRELSAQTQASTAEIGSTVAALQEGVRVTASFMQSACEQSKGDAGEVVRLGEQLQLIAGASRQVGDMLEQIAAAADEQAETAQAISSNILRVDEASMQILESAREVNGVATRLKSGCASLKDTTQRFRLYTPA